MTTEETDVVDLAGISGLLDVKLSTPNQWRQRRILPEPDWPGLTRPLWRRKTILLWAWKTGRLPERFSDEVRRLRASDDTKPVPEVPQQSPRVEKQKPTFVTKEDIGAQIPKVIFQPAPLDPEAVE